VGKKTAGSFSLLRHDLNKKSFLDFSKVLC